MSTAACTLTLNAYRSDAPYLEAFVRHLNRVHPGPFASRDLVLDTKPPARRFRGRPMASQDHMRWLGRRLVEEGLIDRVIEVAYAGDEYERVSRKWFGRTGIDENWRGACVYAYALALERVETRFALHFDCDVLVHQAAPGSWVGRGIALLEADPRAIATGPHPGPPPAAAGDLWEQPEPYTVLPDGTATFAFFTSRRFLIDVERFSRALLPLAPYAVASRRARLRSLLPGGSTAWAGFELMATRRIAERGLYRRDLPAADAWAIHTPDHGPAFLMALPAVIARVERGDVPPRQAGGFELMLDEWCSAAAPAAAPAARFPAAAAARLAAATAA